jgi:2-oxoglutarate ferredoxin oxidoreductase subunit beta
MAEQLEQARTRQPADLGALLAGSDTWTVSA